MNTFRKLAITVGSFIGLLTLPGCWDYQRINYRASVTTIGIDPAEGNPDMLQFTVQVPTFTKTQSGGGEATKRTGGSSFQNFTASAKSFAEAISLIQGQTDKSIFLGNLQLVILNRELKGAQVLNVVTELMRNPRTDKVAWILACDSPTLNVLTQKDSEPPGDKIDRFLGQSVQQHGYTVRQHLWEFWRDCVASGVAPHLGVVKPQDAKVEIAGIYVFQGTQPAVELDKQAAVGYTFLTGTAEDFNYRVANTSPDTSPLVFTNVRAADNYWTTIQNGKPVLKAKIEVTCAMTQDPSGGMETIDAATLMKYRHLMEQSIQADVLATLKQLQQSKTDAYGFGRKLLYRYPELASTIKQQWPDLFAQAQADVQVHVHIQNRGSMM